MLCGSRSDEMSLLPLICLYPGNESADRILRDPYIDIADCEPVFAVVVVRMLNHFTFLLRITVV